MFTMESDNDIIVTKADLSDAEVLTATCKRAFDSDVEYGEPGPGGPPGYDPIEWNKSILTNKWLQYRKILLDDEIVGGFIVGSRGPGYQVCERIWIDPPHMRKGLGRKAFEIIFQKYPSADVWVLGTPEWNTRTNPFYQSLGFVQIGTTHDYPGWDGIYYQKLMKDGIPRAMSHIGDLTEGQDRIILEAEVESISPTRTVQSKKTGEDLQVANATLSDNTGSIELVLWNDSIRQVIPSTRIRIEEGYLTTYRDELKLNISQWGMIITLV